MRVTVVRPGELGRADIDTWRTLHQCDPALASPFLSPEFAISVGGARTDARVAVATEQAATLGFFPFQEEGDGVGAPIGATICDAQAFVCAPGGDWDAAALVGGAGLGVWRFDHLVVSQRPFAPYHQRLHAAPLIDLAGGYDTFSAAVRVRSKDVLQQVARRRRKLGREVGEVRTEWQTTHPAAWADLKRWKSDQYREMGTWDRFAHPWINQVIDALAASTAPGCAGILSATWAGDRVAAVHFGLLGHGQLSWWFPAYDPDLGRYSPGLILLLDLVAEADRRGVTTIDLGRGEHSYKLRVSTGARTVAEGAVAVA